MPQDFLSNEPFLLIHPVHPPLEGELKFQMQAMTTMIERINFVIGNGELQLNAKRKKNKKG
jgi:hypothetical protein